MKTRNIDINYINKKPLCITIGNFDGIHLGHKYIINTMVNESRMNDLYPTVLSFNPHPRKFFSKSKQPFNIITPSFKKYLFNNLGLDLYIEFLFDKYLSSLDPNEFIKQILIKKLSVKNLIIGSDFKFFKSMGTRFKMISKTLNKL